MKMEGFAPILEFDPDRQAIIEPKEVIKHRDLPGHCVLSFFREVIEAVGSALNLQPLPPFKSEMGDLPVYLAAYEGLSFALIPCPVGSPLAAAVLEEIPTSRSLRGPFAQPLRLWYNTLQQALEPCLSLPGGLVNVCIRRAVAR